MARRILPEGAYIRGRAYDDMRWPCGAEERFNQHKRGYKSC